MVSIRPKRRDRDHNGKLKRSSHQRLLKEDILSVLLS